MTWLDSESVLLATILHRWGCELTTYLNHIRGNMVSRLFRSCSLLCKILHYLFMWYFYHLLQAFFVNINVQVFRSYVIFRNHMKSYMKSYMKFPLWFVLWFMSSLDTCFLKIFPNMWVWGFCLFFVLFWFGGCYYFNLLIALWSENRCVFIISLWCFQVVLYHNTWSDFFPLYVAFLICSYMSLFP